MRGNNAVGAVSASFYERGDVSGGGFYAVDIDGHFLSPCFG